ncbi:MAG TPA: hypothetical protein VFK82_03480 [Burkholderiaceae bacterium]|nr:hypothetical protein [Burkholderiaceae bacterium]
MTCIVFVRIVKSPKSRTNTAESRFIDSQKFFEKEAPNESIFKQIKKIVLPMATVCRGPLRHG